ncbi:IclR family transcriptional regulator C-terminal domain-containing protein [Nocardia sp. NPDC046763]|uniref:IclR family transcriptional regulator domain-containing protein n=1 Tax=Nocardia sp. NPDC046763 TaxID=3155256 RepID=UPI0033DE47AA
MGGLFRRGCGLILGLSCIAAPVFDRRGRVIAALSVAGPHGNLEAHRFETTLRQVCAAASNALGRAQLTQTA